MRRRGFAVFLALTLALAWIVPVGADPGPGDATITLGTDPEPPVQIPNPGGVVTIFWDIQYSTTADSVYYRLQSS